MHRSDKIYVAGHRGLVGSALMRRLERGGYARDGKSAGDAMRSILADADRLSGARQG